MKKPRRSNRSNGNQKPRPVTADLASRISRAQGDRRGAGGNSAHGEPQGMAGHNRAMRLGSEFIAAILVGAGIGFFADKMFGTLPWIMLVMLLVGFAAGVLNVTRSVAEMNRANPAPLDADLGPEDDDDYED